VEASSFAIGGRSLQSLQQAFVQKLAPAIAQVCAGRLSQAEAEACLREAGEASGWGRFTYGNNYWMLPGVGDAGSFLLVRVHRRYDTPAGFEPEVLRYAKFSSIESALHAWCKAHGR
jgi:hypothetical protein